MEWTLDALWTADPRTGNIGTGTSDMTEDNYSHCVDLSIVYVTYCQATWSAKLIKWLKHCGGHVALPRY